MADPRVLFVATLAPALLAALVFARAAAFKLRDVQAFADAVETYDILPGPLVAPFARALPLLELVLVAALILPWTHGEADLAAAALLLVFAAAMGVNLARGRRQIDCGCGDPARRQPLAWSLVARNLVLAILLIIAAAVPASAATLSGALIAAAAAAGGLLLILCQEAFAALPAARGAGA
jgi:hypothetical protein